MMFAGMLRYRLSSETYAQLAHYGMFIIACIVSRLGKLISTLHNRRILLRCKLAPQLYSYVMMS